MRTFVFLLQRFVRIFTKINWVGKTNTICGGLTMADGVPMPGRFSLKFRKSSQCILFQHRLMGVLVQAQKTVAPAYTEESVMDSLNEPPVYTPLGVAPSYVLSATSSTTTNTHTSNGSQCSSNLSTNEDVLVNINEIPAYAPPLYKDFFAHATELTSSIKDVGVCGNENTNSKSDGDNHTESIRKSTYTKSSTVAPVSTVPVMSNHEHLSRSFSTGIVESGFVEKPNLEKPCRLRSNSMDHVSLGVSTDCETHSTCDALMSLHVHSPSHSTTSVPRVSSRQDPISCSLYDSEDTVKYNCEEYKIMQEVEENKESRFCVAEKEKGYHECTGKSSVPNLGGHLNRVPVTGDSKADGFRSQTTSSRCAGFDEHISQSCARTEKHVRGQHRYRGMSGRTENDDMARSVVKCEKFPSCPVDQTYPETYTWNKESLQSCLSAQAQHTLPNSQRKTRKKVTMKIKSTVVSQEKTSCSASTVAASPELPNNISKSMSAPTSTHESKHEAEHKTRRAKKTVVVRSSSHHSTRRRSVADGSHIRYYYIGRRE
eukprot:CFRG7825T1